MKKRPILAPENTWNRRVQLAREAAGLSRAEFARRVGISQPSVNDWESGDTESITIDRFMKAAEVLGVTTDWLKNGLGESANQQNSGTVSHTDGTIDEIVNMISVANSTRKAALVDPIRWLIMANDETFKVMTALSQVTIASRSPIPVGEHQAASFFSAYLSADEQTRNEADLILRKDKI